MVDPIIPPRPGSTGGGGGGTRLIFHARGDDSGGLPLASVDQVSRVIYGPDWSSFPEVYVDPNTTLYGMGDSLDSWGSLVPGDIAYVPDAGRLVTVQLSAYLDLIESTPSSTYEDSCHSLVRLCTFPEDWSGSQNGSYEMRSVYAWPGAQGDVLDITTNWTRNQWNAVFGAKLGNHFGLSTSTRTTSTPTVVLCDMFTALASEVVADGLSVKYMFAELIITETEA